jgi:hypothetical protein
MGDDMRTSSGKWFAAAAVMLALAVPALGSTGLSEAQLNGYLIWLHALEETIATREAEGQPEPRLLYPRQLATGRSQEGEDLLDVARALEDLESRPRLLQEPPGRSPSACHQPGPQPREPGRTRQFPGLVPRGGPA